MSWNLGVPGCVGDLLDTVSKTSWSHIDVLHNVKDIKENRQ